MRHEQARVIVAGHICVDVIPTFSDSTVPLESLLVPGKLSNVGPAVISTGGAVSNTGLSLHRLGVPVKLMGKVGRDLFGEAILAVIRGHSESLAEGMIVASDTASSYTLVINPPGVDRIFLHCPGANDSFGAADVPLDQMKGATIFHFGYPPIMRRMYLEDGAELVSLMQTVRGLGVTTSLDMAQPDPASEAGRVDWARILANVLPHVDIFAPSLDETLFMLDRPRFEAMQTGAAGRVPDGKLLHDVASHLLEMGAAVVALKLGDLGLYLRTTADSKRLASAGPALAGKEAGWLGRELATSCFRVKVGGTTGAGDSTIAGLLAALLAGADAEAALVDAVAVGACSVESADATSGVPHWEIVQQRLRAGWEKHPMQLKLEGWKCEDDDYIWFGPADARMNP